jgi:hypothetical protein
MGKRSVTARSQVTNVLRQAVVGWAVKRRYSAYTEVSPIVGLGKRIDVLMLNTRGHLIGVEIKSCAADLRADHKWQEYLPYCNRFYFCVSHVCWADKRFHRLLTERLEEWPNVGVMVLRPDGWARVAKLAKDQSVALATVRKIALKLAWLGGRCKANSRRVRYYLPTADRRPEDLGKLL